MNRNKPAGVVLLFVSIIALIGYAYLLLVSEWKMLVLEITALIIVGVLATIMAWIGFTMATAPEK
jgi:hypothetical protein